MGGEASGSSEAASLLFEARLAELVSARDELISAISNQHLVLTFGTASIVGVFVAGFLTWESEANWAVFFAVPPITAWVLAMWLAEVVRMLRAVEFCREQATIINESIDTAGSHPPIRWEAWRAEVPGRTIRWSYVSVVAVLSGAYLTSFPLGLIVGDWSCGVIAGIAGAFLLGFTLLLGLVCLVYHRWTRSASRVGMPAWRSND
jgi:hypothetical protein